MTNSENDFSKGGFEGFRLTYEHFMNINGEKIRLEEPLVAQCYFDRTFSASPCVLNEILERMKEKIYERTLKENENIKSASEPTRHGRWLKNGDKYCECSVCHHEGNTSGHDNYCWYCGAKMEGVNK